MKDRVTVIKAGVEYDFLENVRHLWEYRNLLLTLARRDVSVRFKQTVVGFAWVIIQPLIHSVIFSIIFNVFAKFDAGATPYPLFVLSGMVLWQFFSRSASEGAGSLINNNHLLSKVYFPRVILPMVPAAASYVDFLLASLVMVGLFVLSGTPVAWTVVLLPLVGLAAGLFAFGIALILAPVNALYRDIGIALPFLIQTLLFLTPVVYPATAIPQRFLWLLDYHPLATLVGLMRWSVFGAPLPSLTALGTLAAVTLVLIGVGMRVMHRLEGSLVDRI